MNEMNEKGKWGQTHSEQADSCQEAKLGGESGGIEQKQEKTKNIQVEICRTN